MLAAWPVLAALTASPPIDARVYHHPTATDESLLRQADLASLAPPSFRARMRLVAPERPQAMEIEVWRSGEKRTLVRFLDPKERGKYLLYRDGILYFLSPGAKKPVKLPPSFRLRGSATLDDILGLRFSRDYVIAGVTDADAPEVMVFDLLARRRDAPFPHVLCLVDRARARPVRSEYRLKSGKTATLVEFTDYDAGPPPRVRRLLLQDLLRGGATTVVELIGFETREIPEALFSLEEGRERRKLDLE